MVVLVSIFQNVYTMLELYELNKP